MNSLQLHRDLLQAFRQLGLKASKPSQVNLALLCQALATCPNYHLAALALFQLITCKGLPSRDKNKNPPGCLTRAGNKR